MSGASSAAAAGATQRPPPRRSAYNLDMALRSARAATTKRPKLEHLTELPPEVAAWGRPYSERDKDLEYIDRHYDDLLKTYPDEWVAIYQLKVIAHAKRHATMWREVQKQKLVEKSPVTFFFDTHEP
jgi:hypothetical protein